MKRLAVLVCLLPLSLFSCHQPVHAKETAVLNEADKLFTSGKYEEALTHYDKALPQLGDDKLRTRALYRAIECETLLYRHEAALDRIRAAKLPSDAVLRGILTLTKVEMLHTLQSWYGFSEETEEGATGSAKLSRAQAERERDAAIAELWHDRAALAKAHLSTLGDYFVIKDADLARYPSLWDFTVLKLTPIFQSMPRKKSDPRAFAGEDFARDFSASQSPLARLGALYEESAHLGGDRDAAGERWRVARVMLGSQANGTRKEYEAWTRDASTLLQSWAHKLSTALGRGDAAVQAVGLMANAKQRAAALRLIDEVLPRTPESDVALNLRRARQSIIEPELALTAHVTQLPAKQALNLVTRNLKDVHFRLYRMRPLHDTHDNFYSQAYNVPRVEDVTATLRQKPDVEWQLATGDKGDHESVALDADVPVQDLGLYMIVAAADPHFTVGERTLHAAFLNVTELAVARVESAHGVRYYAFDAGKNAPASDVVFHLQTSYDWRTKGVDEIKAGGDGVASWPMSSASYVQVDAMAARGKAVALFANPSWMSQPGKEPPLVLYLASDRPIYRPGQTLEVRVTSVERARDGYKIDAHRKIELALVDPNGKQLGAKQVTTGAMGSAAAKFDVPMKGLLGQYHVQATVRGFDDVAQALYLRVEEYKRPEFEVTLDAPKTATRYGDTTRVSGSVKYYFGGVAPDVAVKFKISRQKWIPWWLWYRGDSNKTEIARGEIKSNKSGTFDVDFTAARDPESASSDDPDAPDVSDFIVEVEAHDAGGRTISAERRVRVGATSTLIAADSERGFFMSDEGAELRVKATNLEEQPIDADVQWTLEKLGPPPPRPRDDNERDASMPLQARLKAFPSDGATLGTGTLHASKDQPGKLTLPRVPAGAYRVRFVEPKSGAKGLYHVLIADKKSRALPFVGLPSLAIARRNDLEPGETAEVLLGAGETAGNYHVEKWQGDKLVEDRVDKGAPVRVVSVPVTPKLAGGFTVRFVGNHGLAILGADVELRVPRKDKLLTVKIAPKPDAVEPGAQAHFGVEISDGKGKPVTGEALVTVYDRSLELYAKSGGNWAESLWSPPGPPRGRTDGVTSRWAMQVPVDPAEQRKIEQHIQGAYKAQRVPGFTWEQSRYEGFGGGGYRTMSANVVSGGMPPPAPAMAPAPGAPQAQPMRKKSRGHGGDNDADGILDSADKEESGEHEKQKAPPPGPELRTNMAETALFLPDLKLENGKGQFSFAAPERLTSWRVRVLAMGRLVEAGTAETTFATKKQLMVRVEIPRFVREGDRATVQAIVHNETEHPLQAHVKLTIVDDAQKHDALAELGIKDPERTVDVPAHGLTPVEYTLNAPDNIATYLVRASATAGKLSDAEERPLPLLPSRERLVQSRVIALKGNDKQSIEFPELLHSTDASLRSEAMTVSIDPQLALSVLRAIPSLVQYPYECVEQTLNRYVPLAIVDKIYEKHPELAQAIAKAPHRETENEPWLKDDPRRMLQLTETPWLQQSEGGRRDWMLQSLLDPKLVSQLREDALAKLGRMQNGSGAFPWFPGGRDNFYMTLYVLEQLAQLQDFGVDVPTQMVERALGYVRSEMPQYEKKEEANVAFLAYGAYVVTAFDGKRFPAAAALRGDVGKWMRYVLDNRTILTPYGRAWCARVEARLGDQKLALELLDSALDGAKTDPVVGVYWTPERYSWLWYTDSVEKHAFFLRTLAALKPDDAKIPGMLQWLLFNRKGNVWHSTKASAAAVYAILDLMQKMGSLTKPEQFHVVWDKHEDLVTVKPNEDRREPIMWTRRGREVTAASGHVDIGKQGPGIAFASATWIYSSTKLQEAHASNLVSLERKYFRRVKQSDGEHLIPLQSGDRVHVGEEIEVRLYVKTKSQFEYVHVKEPRGAGFEETTLTSGYRWDKLASYQEPRDSLFNFFVDWLPHGEFELRHSLRPATVGKFRIGSAVLQSMYSPDITAYSSGIELEVVK